MYEKTNGGAVTKYYGAFGRNLAVRSVPTGTGPGTLSYLLADHLGSTVGALDAAGNSLGTQSYWPFGAARSQTGGIATDKLYTSQQRESLTTTQTPLQGATDALGTYFYGARFYSPVTGRFASADSLVQGLGGKALNRYSYVINDPVNYNDPSGHCFTFVGGKSIDADCTEDDIIAWITCAFTCTGVWKDVALVGIQSLEFWQHASDFIALGEGDMVFVGNLLGGIAGAAKPSGLFFEVLSGTLFFSVLASAFGVSPRYFAASFYDMIFEAELTRYLIGDRPSLMGADMWWLLIPEGTTFRGSGVTTWTVLQSLDDLTQDLAGRMSPTEVWLAPWSDIQRLFLHPHFPQVALPGAPKVGIPGAPNCTRRCTDAALKAWIKQLSDLNRVGKYP